MLTKPHGALYDYRLDKRASDLGLTMRRGTLDWFIVDEIGLRDVYNTTSLTLPAAACILDVGANIGAFAARALERWPTARVTCIEMDAANAAQAARHLAGRARVIVAAVVGDRVPSGYRRDAENSGGHHLVYDGASRSDVAPSMMTLAQAIDATECSGVDLLKMDVEGAEHDILALAARDGALDRVRRIVMEWHEFATGQQLRTLVATLLGAGFNLSAPTTRTDDATGMLSAVRT